MLSAFAGSAVAAAATAAIATSKGMWCGLVIVRSFVMLSFEQRKHRSRRVARRLRRRGNAWLEGFPQLQDTRARVEQVAAEHPGTPRGESTLLRQLVRLLGRPPEAM